MVKSEGVSCNERKWLNVTVYRVQWEHVVYDEEKYKYVQARNTIMKYTIFSQITCRVSVYTTFTGKMIK